MTKSVGKGKQEMNRRRRPSGLRDAVSKRFDKTLEEKQERLAFVHFILKVVMCLEELLQFGKTKGTPQPSGKPQPQFDAFVSKPGRHLLALETGEGPERLNAPEMELFIKPGSGLGDDEGKLVEPLDPLFRSQMPDSQTPMERRLSRKAGERRSFSKSDYSMKPAARKPLTKAPRTLMPLPGRLCREIERENPDAGFFNTRHPAQSDFQKSPRRRELRRR